MCFQFQLAPLHRGYSCCAPADARLGIFMATYTIEPGAGVVAGAGAGPGAKEGAEGGAGGAGGEDDGGGGGGSGGEGGSVGGGDRDGGGSSLMSARYRSSLTAT